MELHQDNEENKCSGKQTGSSEQHFGDAHPKEYCRDMGAYQAIPGEKQELCEEMDESKCSEIKIHFPEQHFGGARPKEYCRDMGANQAIPGEKREHCEDAGKSRCSEIQIHFPEHQFHGTHSKEHHTDMGAYQAIPVSGGKLGHFEGVEESKCSGIQIGNPEQYFGAHLEEHHGDMNASKTIPDQDVPKKYYAVAFPTEDFIIKDDPLIFEQKKDALQAIQQNPGARFREFTSRGEALQYASIPYETQVAPSLSEANLTFKTLSKQELVQFQTCIKNGDVTYFLELVWSNPHYLINENDYPTVIQEETKFNALHIAVIHWQTRMFVQVLHVLQDIQFMSIVYPKDELSRIQARIRCLVGFYLNITESVFGETPLYLACRFGHEDIVQIILAFSEALLKNRLDKSIGDIICQSHDCSVDHKRSILHLFTEMYYVPIVQDEVCKYVAKPCDGQTVLAAMTTHPLKAGSPAIYCAFAGPAPYVTAKKIYQHLKRNKYVFLKAPLNDVMASSQKRIEKDGRKLSKKYHIGWIEYWRSLDTWLDISSSKGLKFLEKHLNKLDIQINVLPDEPPLFLDIIQNFVEECVVKISEITVTCDKLGLFHELQTLVLFMDCFIKYPFSDEVKIFDIHEELGHILFLKLTEDNHKNLENFQILKLLLLSQFSYVSCYQKSIWKMFCCVLRFASYFQQDSEFVVKPVCQCDFAIVEDLCIYSSKSCYFKLLSWRQDITNELVQKYEAMFENPLLGERETPNIPLSSDAIAAETPNIPLSSDAIAAETPNIPLSSDAIAAETPNIPLSSDAMAAETPNIPLSSDATTAEKDHDDFAADVCTLEEYIQSYEMNQVHMYKKYYFQSTTFIFVFCTLILKSYEVSENFIEIFQNVIKSWEPICKLNYEQDIHLTSIHYEMALCLFVQFFHIPAEIVQWCRMHLKREISSAASSSREWTHLMCVTSLFLTMWDGDKFDTCECHYNIDPATESVHPFNCIMLLRRLRRQLISFKLRASESQMRSDLVESKEEGGKDQSGDKEEVFVTPPDSSPRTKSIYVEGDIFSDEDINIYHALVEARVDISKYHHIGKWKSLVKHRYRS